MAGWAWVEQQSSACALGCGRLIVILITKQNGAATVQSLRSEQIDLRVLKLDGHSAFDPFAPPSKHHWSQIWHLDAILEALAELQRRSGEDLSVTLYSRDGAYAGFDKEEFTSRSGGKANAIVHLKKEHGYHPMVMVGDGATDLEARTDGGAEVFIGYGGIQVRDKVALGADWFVYSFEPLIDALK
ncbi:hypothetical protein CYMTET_28765 [Cymbomonas tetramitiformis]|uniref:phosphoserine phosphatase n=1 Tax=Cymbomonas tetramitiformis TaxID=36881 RepID=A0AAE0FMH3_9CHLO|nr:hypothetical protein CYMTET_28765 [Cymbomonas tetramitiformis]